MTGGLGPSRLFQEPFHTSGTVVAHPFHTTVPWNDWSGTMERFWSKSLRRQEFSSCRRWNEQPFERGALAPLSGRSVPLLSREGNEWNGETGSSLTTASVHTPDGLMHRRQRCPAPLGNVSGRRSRDKGARTEGAIMRLLLGQEIAATKISRMHKPDAEPTMPPLSADRVVEVKCRATGFAQLYNWLDERDIPIVKAHRRKPSIVLRMSLAAEIAERAA